MTANEMGVLLLDGPEALAALGTILATSIFLALASLIALVAMVLQVFLSDWTGIVSAQRRKITYGIALYAASLLCLFVPPYFVITHGFTPGNWFMAAAAMISATALGLSLTGQGPGRILVATASGTVCILTSGLLIY